MSRRQGPAARPARRPAARPVLRLGEAVSLPIDRRALTVGMLVVVAILLAGFLTLTLGSLGIAPAQLLPALFSDPGGTEGFVLGRLRGPRLTVAIATGAALGVSGALFQTVTRNPLGSPDVIGLGVGASAGAATVGLLYPGVLPVPAGALIGAAVAIVLVWLGTGRGFSSPARFIIVGIGVSAMGSAYTQFVIARAGREQALVLSAYLNGTLASRGWDDAVLIWGALAALVPIALLLGRRLHLIEMGDEMADALGARSGRTRIASIAVAVCLSAAAVSVAGPIAFVALTAPQIAKRLGRSPGTGILLSALTGALILVAADLLVQQSLMGVQLPVGILTAVVGGVYLGYLLIRESRKGTL